MQFRRLTLLALFLVVVTATPGCVRRRLTIRSNPPGARVFVDDQEIGLTPTSTPFTYYGTRKIQLFKDGFETVTLKERIHPPWYQLPVLDFITENLWPAEIRDERIVDVDMPAQRIVPNQELVNRAQALRSNAHAGVAVPLPNAVAPFEPIPSGPSFRLPPPNQLLPNQPATNPYPASPELLPPGSPSPL